MRSTKEIRKAFLDSYESTNAFDTDEGPDIGMIADHFISIIESERAAMRELIWDRINKIGPNNDFDSGEKSDIIVFKKRPREEEFVRVYIQIL